MTAAPLHEHTPAQVSIRRALPKDLALVASFVRELAEFERLSLEVDATSDDFAAALFGEQPRVFCEIIESAGQPAGFAVWFYNFSTFRGRHGIYLEDLFVRPDYRGKGLGKALLQNLAQRCVAEGLTRLEWAVLDWNTSAIGFYEAQGAELVSGWKSCRLAGTAIERLAAATGLL